jgi:hypothetical protein
LVDKANKKTTEEGKKKKKRRKDVAKDASKDDVTVVCGSKTCKADAAADVGLENLTIFLS